VPQQMCILQNTPDHSNLYDPILRGVSAAPHFDIYKCRKMMVLTVRYKKYMGCHVQWVMKLGEQKHSFTMCWWVTVL